MSNRHGLGYVAWNPSDNRIPDLDSDVEGWRDWADQNNAMVVVFPRVDGNFLNVGDSVLLRYLPTPGDQGAATTVFPAGSRIVFFLLRFAWNQFDNDLDNPQARFGRLGILSSMPSLNRQGLQHAVIYRDETVVPSTYVFAVEQSRRPRSDAAIDLQDTQVSFCFSPQGC
eukprot:scaffold279_cov229-Pinguiococcus_pyrenoidosus.AAC.34